MPILLGSAVVSLANSSCEQVGLDGGIQQENELLRLTSYSKEAMLLLGMPRMIGVAEDWCERCELPLSQCVHSPTAAPNIDAPLPSIPPAELPLTNDANSSWWIPYSRWNRAIASVIYCPENAGIPVFLDLEDDLLRRAASMVGSPSSTDGDLAMELAEAVRATLDHPDLSGGVFDSHLRRIKIWRTRSGQVPPPIALLAVLSLAAEDMTAGDGLAAHNYYDRLMPLLGISSEKSKKKVIDAYRRCSNTLWECLNGWLEDLQGERGLPTAYAYTHTHIGRPMSQALIRATDRESIGHFFAEIELPPSHPSLK